MRRVRMLGVSFAAGPPFMQQVCTGRIGSAVQVITKATILFARRSDQRAQLGFENRLLAFPRPQNHDQRDCLFRQLDAGACASACLGSGRLAGPLLCSTLRHAGGDCIPNGLPPKSSPLSFRFLNFFRPPPPTTPPSHSFPPLCLHLPPS